MTAQDGDNTDLAMDLRYSHIDRRVNPLSSKQAMVEE